MRQSERRTLRYLTYHDISLLSSDYVEFRWSYASYILQQQELNETEGLQWLFVDPYDRILVSKRGVNLFSEIRVFSPRASIDGLHPGISIRTCFFDEAPFMTVHKIDPASSSGPIWYRHSCLPFAIAEQPEII